jgi:hypothetical protein
MRQTGNVSCIRILETEQVLVKNHNYNPAERHIYGWKNNIKKVLKDLKVCYVSGSA